jgi:hypothetical protein
VLLSQVTASPPWPASMIALRSLSASDDDARLALGAHHVGEGRHLQPVGAVAGRGAGDTHVGDARIFVADICFCALAIPPRVLEDAVRAGRIRWKSSHARRTSPSSGRDTRPAEPGALVDHALQPAGPSPLNRST